MEPPKRLQTTIESVTRLFRRSSEAPTAPRLSNPVRYPFGEFEFVLQASGGGEVELQTSRDFKQWDALDKATVGRKPVTISDKKASNDQRLFYRAVSGSFVSNVIGFVAFEVPPGHSIITNPLPTAANHVESLFPGVPDDTALNKFNLVTFSLDKNKFTRGKWEHPTQSLLPGEGALIYNPTDTPWTARLVGEVSGEEQKMHIHAGTSLRASFLPLTGRLDTDLGFPVQPGDVISLYSNRHDKYVEFRYTENGWAGEAPFLRLGEAFWVAKNTSAVWKQKMGETGFGKPS